MGSVQLAASKESVRTCRDHFMCGTFGYSHMSRRLLALVFATCVLGRDTYGEADGLYAGLRIVTSAGIYLYALFLTPEGMIALWSTLGYHFFLEHSRTRSDDGCGLHAKSILPRQFQPGERRPVHRTD